MLLLHSLARDNERELERGRRKAIVITTITTRSGRIIHAPRSRPIRDKSRGGGGGERAEWGHHSNQRPATRFDKEETALGTLSKI